MKMELDGKVYRLVDQRQTSPDTKSVCGGCAFKADTCMTIVKDDSCVTELESYAVWEEVK